MRCFSKVWWDAVTPGERFVAVMTCSAADQACPAVAGALARVSLTYLDPKAFDDDPDPARGYDERCAQIAREMLYLFEVAAS